MRSPAPNRNFPVCLPADAAAAGKPPGPCAASLRAGRDRLVRLSRRLDDSPLGDLIGAAAVFAILFILLFLGV